MALTQEYARDKRSRQPLGVLIADLDHFKRVNDTYGYPVGDTVLQETARRRREIARRDDHVGRIGGEEFLMVVPNCDLNTLRECAERVRSFISDLPFATPSGLLSITVSIGGTIWSSEHPLRSESLHKIDGPIRLHSLSFLSRLSAFSRCQFTRRQHHGIRLITVVCLPRLECGLDCVCTSPDIA